jgi:hypothetical protein
VILSSSPGNKKANLGWTSYTGFQPSAYHVEMLKGTNWVLIDSVPANELSYTDSNNLGCNQLYNYRIKAVETGTANFGYSDTAVVIPYDTILPLSPVLNYVSVVSNSQVLISWNLSASPDVKNYEVWRSIGGGAFTQAATVSGFNQYTDNGLDPANNTYAYFIIAVDSCNLANRSTPSDTDQTMNLSTSSYGCSPLVRLNWNTYTTFNQGLAGYVVMRSENGGPAMNIASLGPLQNSYTDSSVSLSSEYCYAIGAFSTGGIFSSISDSDCIRPSEVQLTDTAKVLVVTVTKSGVTDGETVISWEMGGVTDTVARGYRLYHSTVSAGGPYNLIHTEGDLGMTTFTHSNINTFTDANYYTLVIFDVCNKITDSADSHSPVNISLANGNLATKVSWTAYKGWDNFSYILEKSDVNGNFYTLATLPDDSNSFTDTMVLCGRQYFYRIVTVNSDNSLTSWSDVDSIISIDAIAPAMSRIHVATVTSTGDVTGAIEIKYDASAETNRSGYKVYRSVNGSSFTLLQAVSDLNSGVLSWSDNNINTRDDVHAYMVSVTDSCGNESAPAAMHEVVNLSGTAVNRATDLSWSPYTGFGSFTYTLERLDPLFPWKQIAVLPSTLLAWKDSTTRCNTDYSYRIAVTDAGGTLVSYSDTITVSSFENETPTAGSLRKVTVTETSKTSGKILVSWDHSTSPDVGGYLLQGRIAGTGVWTTLSALGFVNTYTAVNLNTADFSYEFRISTADSCGNVSNYAAVHATVNLTLSPGNQKVNMAWNNYTGWAVDSFEIYRQNILMGKVGPNTFTYADTPLSCMDIFGYRVVAVEKGGNLETSQSDTASVTPYDSISTAGSYIKTATVEMFNDKVKVEWTRVQGFDMDHYELQQRVHNQWKTIYKSSGPLDTSYTDELSEDASETGYCYRIYAFDRCGNKSVVSNEACLIRLSGTSGNLSSTLNWTTYRKWNGGVKGYKLYRSDDNGTWNLVAELKPGTLSYTDEGLVNDVKEFCYAVVGEEDSGSFDALSQSNRICLMQQPVFWLPNSFSPGSSFGLNDEFGPSGTFIADYDLSIYNRWGQKIFRSSGAAKNWDGTYVNGKLVEDGAYMYTIKVLSHDGNVYEKEGLVIIIK